MSKSENGSGLGRILRQIDQLEPWILAQKRKALSTEIDHLLFRKSQGEGLRSTQPVPAGNGVDHLQSSIKEEDLLGDESSAPQRNILVVLYVGDLKSPDYFELTLATITEAGDVLDWKGEPAKIEYLDDLFDVVREIDAKLPSNTE